MWHIISMLAENGKLHDFQEGRINQLFIMLDNLVGHVIHILESQRVPSYLHLI